MAPLETSISRPVSQVTPAQRQTTVGAVRICLNTEEVYDLLALAERLGNPQSGLTDVQFRKAATDIIQQPAAQSVPTETLTFNNPAIPNRLKAPYEQVCGPMTTLFELLRFNPKARDMVAQIITERSTGGI